MKTKDFPAVIAAGRLAEHQLRYYRDMMSVSTDRAGTTMTAGRTNHTAFAAPKVAESWEHLKRYGYAPGSYMNRCVDCKKVVEDLDKRASRCRPCAETLHSGTQSTTLPNDPIVGLVLGAVARGWCSEKNKGKEMDFDLAHAISEEVIALIKSMKDHAATPEKQ